MVRDDALFIEAFSVATRTGSASYALFGPVL